MVCILHFAFVFVFVINISTSPRSINTGGSNSSNTKEEVERLRLQVNDLKEKVHNAEQAKYGSNHSNNNNSSNLSGNCAKCGKKIEGRPYKASNGKSYHRACHICDDCGNSLIGKRFAIVPLDDGSEKRMCESCTAKYNDELIKQTQEQDRRMKQQKGHVKRQSGSSQMLAMKLNELRKFCFCFCFCFVCVNVVNIFVMCIYVLDTCGLFLESVKWSKNREEIEMAV